MGLALLANLAAHDFGYLSTGQLIERTTNALGSMEALERYRGHFYNWYDTQTRLPLVPLYVSTVDSGNLAGHLLTLRPGLTALCDAPILNRRWLEGIGDTLAILIEAVGATAQWPLSRNSKRRSHRRSPRDRSTLADAWGQVELLAAHAADVVAHLTASDLTDAETPSLHLGPRPRAAMHRFARRADFPGAVAGAATPPGQSRDLPGSNGIPTLREIAALDAAAPPIVEQARVNGSGAEDAKFARQPAKPRHARCAARRSENGGDRRAGAAGDRTCRNGLRLPVRQGASATGDRIQRRASSACDDELLRPAGIGSATVQFRRHRAGQAAAGKLVRARAPADLRRRRARSCWRGAARCSNT